MTKYKTSFSTIYKGSDIVLPTKKNTGISKNAFNGELKVEKRFTPSTHRTALFAGGPVMTFLYIVGWMVFAQMIPTPSPGLNPEELAKWIVDHKPGLLFGCLLMIAGCGLWGTWLAQTIVWTFRTESQYPVLTFAQLICGAAGLTFFMFDTLFWGVATFRAGEINPEITQQMWDIGWFGFLFTITVYIAWAVSWALGVLLNPPHYQLFPRWVAYITLGSVVCWSPGLLVIFFKEGPFAYSGRLAMWLPITEFFIWLMFVEIYARKAIKLQVELSRKEGLTFGKAYGLYPPRDPDLPFEVEPHIPPTYNEITDQAIRKFSTTKTAAQ